MQESKLGEEIKKYKKEIKDIPLWLKYSVAFSTVFGAIFGFWGVYVVINDNNSRDKLLGSATATSSVPIDVTTILDMAYRKDTAMEQKEFLNKYKDVKVFVDGYFKDIINYGEGYNIFLDSSIISFKNIPVVCSLNNLDEDEKREIFLLKKRDRVFFEGIFTGSSYNGAAWYIKDCSIKK